MSSKERTWTSLNKSRNVILYQGHNLCNGTGLNLFFISMSILFNNHGQRCMFWPICAWRIQITKPMLLYWCIRVSEGVNDCCLTPNEQFFSYIMVRTSYISMIWCCCLFGTITTHYPDSEPTSLCFYFLKLYMLSREAENAIL